MRSFTMTAVLCVGGIAASIALAIPPPYDSDDELAQMPVLVVAHWEKAPFREHNDIEGNVLNNGESFTNLIVDRVLVGDLNVGSQVLLLKLFVGWAESGGQVLGRTPSVWMEGDVSDVCEKNLWCLKWDRSWDKADRKKYLTISSYRCVQPLVLEPYFLAMKSAKPDDAVAKLLKSQEQSVCLRALEYMHGGTPPWPWWTEHEEWYRGKAEPARRRVGYSGQVEPLMHHDSTEVRRMATAVYGSLLGAKAAVHLRPSLKDGDEGVRAIAIGLLAEAHDADAVGDICTAARGIQDAKLGSAAVDRLAGWGDERLVPALIEFLGAKNYGGSTGDDILIPALRAQIALKKITGFEFTLDSHGSDDAWKKVCTIRDRAERLKALAQLLPDDPRPLSARAIGRDGRFFVEVSNHGKQPVTAATRPSVGDIRYPSGLHGLGKHAKDPSDFATLAPGGSLRFPIKLPDRFLIADPDRRNIQLRYYDSGRLWGLSAWQGIIDVVFAEGWEQPPPVRAVGDSFWPNGNWKERGMTADGLRIGKWEFYNEAGDRIMMRDYTEGGEGDYDPEHPANKGLGIRKAASRPASSRSTEKP